MTAEAKSEARWKYEQTRGPTCAEEHSQSRRRLKTAARQEITRASGQARPASSSH